MWLAIAIIILAVGLIVWGTTRKGRLGYWARVVVMALSGGFLFPNAATEDKDITKHDTDKSAEVKKSGNRYDFLPCYFWPESIFFMVFLGASSSEFVYSKDKR